MTDTVVVTGGCGYIGSRLVPELLRAGRKVRVLDCQIFGIHLPEEVLGDPRLAVTVGDIRDRDLVARTVDGADAVIHLAAMANDPSAELDPELTRQINLDAALDLLAAARRSGVRRFVNASTATVYGVREESDVDETFEHRPITLYGKYKSETDIATAGENGARFTTVNLRSATVCGWSPRMRLDLTVNILAEQARNRGEIVVHGGTQKRPNIVIGDLVRAYLCLLEAPHDAIGGQSFNVSASNRTVLEIAQVVAEAVNPAAKVTVAPIQDLRSYHISARKALEVLGFRPLHDIADGAREVAGAISAGTIRDTGRTIYRNVAHMRAVGYA